MSVRKRKYPNGKVVWKYSFEGPGSGRTDRNQIEQSGFTSKKAALDAEAARRIAAQHEFEAKGVTASLPSSLAGMLEAFFKEHGESNLEAKTLERYRQNVTYLSGDLLALPVSEVTALHLRREWNRLLAEGGHHRHTKAARPLSAKTVRNIAGTLSSAYTRAIRWGITATNPVPASEPPTPKTQVRTAMTPTQTRLMIDAARSTWGLSRFLELDAATGARRGELLALRWSDLVGDTLFIARSLSQTKAGLEFKSTKNKKPKVVTLPLSALKVLDAHRSEQKKLREQFGSDYQTDLDLIFCQPDGLALRPDSVSAAVSLLYKTLKLPKGSSLHAVRHAHASQLLAAGVPLPDVSKRLGHSNVFTTASVYAHSLPNADAEAARRWEEFQKQSEATPRPHQRKV